MFFITLFVFLSKNSNGLEDQETIDEMCVNVIRDMNEFGVCVLDNFIGADKGKKVLEEVKNMYNAGYFKVSKKKLKI